LATYVAPTLYGNGNGASANILDSFRNTGDNRITKVREINNWAKKQNISISFDPKKFMCLTCPVSHPVGHVGSQRRPVFALYDQCFPPMAAAAAGGGCLAVMRIEDGTLCELADLLIEHCRNRWLPNGTVVIMAAGGQMAREGTAAYASALVAAVNKVKKFLPAGSFVAHGPLAFACGINDPATIRTAFEICHWQVTLDREGAVGDLLPLANMATIRMLERRAVEVTRQLAPIRLTLPANMAGTLYRCWSVGDGSPLPAATEPLTEEDEAELLYLLGTEINRKLGIGLDTKFETVRMVASGMASDSRVILVGGQHALGLAKAAQDSGQQYTSIPLEGNPTVGQVSMCARNLREVIEEVPPGSRAGVVVVFSILDNLLYMAKNSEGGINPLKPPKKGVQHVPGQLVLATGEMLEERLAKLTSLLNSICGASAVLLCPLPRHISSPCCQLPGHMPGYATDGHKVKLLEAIDATRRKIKDELYKMRVRGIQVANYARTAIERGFKDPITLTEEGYGALLERILSEGVNRQVASRLDKGKRPPASQAANNSKKFSGRGNL